MSENIKVGGSGNLHLEEINVPERRNSIGPNLNKAEKENIDSLRRSYSFTSNKVNNQIQNNKLDGWEEVPFEDNSVIHLQNALKINRSQKNITAIDKKIFVSDFQEKTGDQRIAITPKTMPELLNLQKLASQCPLDFKKKCSELDIDLYGALSAMYKLADTPSKKAYVDLLMTQALANRITKLAQKQMPKNMKNEINQKTLQALIGNLIAQKGNKNALDAAMTKIADYLGSVLNRMPTTDPKKINNLARIMHSVANLMDGISKNKIAYASNLEKREEYYKNAADNISKLDLNNFKFKDFDLEDKTIAGQKISKLYGSVSEQVNKKNNIDFNTRTKNESYQASISKINKLADVKNTVDISLRDSTYHGHTIDSLKKLVVNEGFSNEYLLKQIDNESTKNRDKIKSTIEKLFANNPTPDQIVNDLESIRNDLSRKVSAEQRSELIDLISDKFANLNAVQNQEVDSEEDNENDLNKSNNPLNKSISHIDLSEANDDSNIDEDEQISFDDSQDNGPVHENQKPTDNFKIYKNIMSEAKNDPNIKNHFTEIMNLFNKEDYSFEGLKELSHADVDEVGEDAAVLDVIKKYASALENKESAINFLKEITDVKIDTPAKRMAMANLLDPLTRNPDPTVSQMAQQYRQTLVLMTEAQSALDKINAEGGENAYGEHTPAIKGLLEKMTGDEWAKMNDAELLVLAKFATEGPLDELSPYWNTAVDAAYHAFILQNLQDGKIDDAPANIHAITAEEMAPGANIQPENPNDIRKKFVDSLTETMKQRLADSNMGLVREKSIAETTSNISSGLNSKFSDYRALKTLLTASKEGKQILATKELKKLIKSFGATDEDKLDNLKPDEIIKLGINKSDLILRLNAQSGVPKEHTDLQIKLNKQICMPTISKLEAKQKILPGETLKGEDTAVTISVIRDALLDDLTQVNSEVLKSYGINKDNFTFSPEEIEMAEKIAKFNIESQQYAYKLQQAIENKPENQDAAEIIASFEKPNPPFEGYPNEESKALTNKLDNAMNDIGKHIAEMAHVKPLPKVTKLMLDKYLQLAVLTKGSAIAANLNPGLVGFMADDDTFKELQTSATKLINNHNNTTELAKDENLIKLVVNDLCTQNGIDVTKNKADYDALIDSLKEPKLTVAQKKEVLVNLKILDKNIDPATFTESNEQTDFSNDLKLLAEADEENFNNELTKFSQTHLNVENTTTADSLVTYKLYNRGNNVNGAKESFGTAFNTENQPEIVKTLQDKYVQGVVKSDKALKVAIADYRLKSNEAELLKPLGRELLGDLQVRALVRLSASYAAAKLGYSGKEEVYAAFKDSNTSEADKQAILNAMVDCMKTRGLDESMAKLLANTRLQQAGSEFFIARAFNKIKNTFLDVANDISKVGGAIKRFFTGNTAYKEQLQNNYHVYLPAIQGMVSRIGVNETRYVSRNMDFKFTFNFTDVFQSVADTNIGTIKAGIKASSDAAVMITRNKDGNIKVSLNASILKLAVDADAIFIAYGAKGIGANATAGGGLNRVVDLNFNSDEEASAFLCKMFTCNLTNEDVKAANDVAAGSQKQFGAGVTLRLNPIEILQNFLFPDELKAMTNAPDAKSRKALEKKFGEEHPTYQTLVDYTRFFNATLGFNASTERGTKYDNTGSTETKKSTYTITHKAKVFEFRPGKQRLDLAKDNLGVDKIIGAQEVVDETLQIIKDTTTDILNIESDEPDTSQKFVDGVKKIDKKISTANKLFIPRDQTVIENETIIHRSAGKNIIDEAYDKTTHNYMDTKQIDELYKEGLISEQLKDNLTKLAESGKITKYTIVRKMKQDVIDANRNDPKALEREASKIKSNYYVSEIQIETSGASKVVEENTDWLNFITGGWVSYKVNAQSSSTNTLQLKYTGMKNSAA